MRAAICPIWACTRAPSLNSYCCANNVDSHNSGKESTVRQPPDHEQLGAAVETPSSEELPSSEIIFLKLLARLLNSMQRASKSNWFESVTDTGALGSWTCITGLSRPGGGARPGGNFNNPAGGSTLAGVVACLVFRVGSTGTVTSVRKCSARHMAAGRSGACWAGRFTLFLIAFLWLAGAGRRLVLSRAKQSNIEPLAKDKDGSAGCS